MTVNSLYPAFAKIKYSSNGHTHYMTVPLTAELTEEPPGLSSDQYMFTQQNGTTIDFQTAITAFVNLIKVYYPAASNFILAELWQMSDVDADPIFYTAAILGIVGTSASAVVPYSQTVMSLRTSVGGILKIYLMENIQTNNSVDDYPFAFVGSQNLGGYLIGGTSIIRGRDGGKIVSPLRCSTKTNDALRKKYLFNS